MRFLNLCLCLCFLALCLDVTKGFEISIHKSVTQECMKNDSSEEEAELTVLDIDSGKKKQNNTPLLYFQPEINESLWYHENKSCRLECVAKNINPHTLLMLTDPQNTPITNNTRCLKTLTVAWNTILTKADDGKTIVCTLQLTVDNNGKTKFKDILNMNVTLRLMEEEEAKNTSKDRFVSVSESKSLVLETIVGAVAVLICLMVLAVIVFYRIRKKRKIANTAMQPVESDYATPYVHYATLDLATPSNVQATSERAPYAKIVGILKVKRDMSDK